MGEQTNFNDDMHFTIANIPFGVVSTKSQPQSRLIATRLGSHVYILPDLIRHRLLKGLTEETENALHEPLLNQFASLGPSASSDVRRALQSVLAAPSTPPNPALMQCRHHKSDVINRLPIRVGDFTDFSCSMAHVLNASEAMTGRRMLPPCFLHFPPGYSGRCSSIVPSGTSIKRPSGQYKDQSGKIVYGPSSQVDFELEMAAVVGQPTEFGKPVHISDGNRHIFGLLLLNDWSARDIQALEMMPLGPLGGKSFGTTISPWIVTLEALENFACPAQPHDHSITTAPYLQQMKKNNHYSIHTQVDIIHSGTSTTVCKSNFQSLYWSLSSLVAHQTSNGCSLNAGDLLGTGTISGSTPGSYGCFLESTRGGRDPLTMSNGETRTYLQDGDAVQLTAWAGELGTDSCVGFGEAFGTLEDSTHEVANYDFIPRIVDFIAGGISRTSFENAALYSSVQIKIGQI